MPEISVFRVIVILPLPELPKTYFPSVFSITIHVSSGRLIWILPSVDVTEIQGFCMGTGVAGEVLFSAEAGVGVSVGICISSTFLRHPADRKITERDTAIPNAICCVHILICRCSFLNFSRKRIDVPFDSHILRGQ